MSGWIKLHRSLLDWEWYDDANATRLLIHLLVSANYEPKRWKGVVIPSGSIVLSWDTLSIGCGLTVQQTRTAMAKLTDSGEVTRKVTNKFQTVTLVKWDQMQSDIIDNNNQANRQITDKQQTNNKQTNRQVTTTKEVKNKRSKNYTKDFESCFDFYHEHSVLPKSDKAAAYKYWVKLTADEKNSIRNTLQKFLEINNDEYCVKFRSYLSGKRWEDDLSGKQPKKKPFQPIYNPAIGG
ncbi:hypothetical protein DRO66_08080 [Candidatus Bathyarchaeota archaeon]|nr:MAG: hypothetical protein DRO66_08080 [Candidatus Bathyarchaeota archaeon]